MTFTATELSDRFADAYPTLRRLAHARLFDGGRNTCLDTTALVHECYMRMANGLGPDDDRAFLGYAARVMRSVVVDAVRERLALRRGGNLQRVTVPTDLPDPRLPEDEILGVHDALARLSDAAPRLATVVEMRYFGGYSDSEIARVLGLNERTVRRDWEKARLLIAALMQEPRIDAVAVDDVR